MSESRCHEVKVDETLLSEQDIVTRLLRETHNNYQSFVKQRNQFGDAVLFKLEDGDDSHTLRLFKKLPKLNSSQTRDTGETLEITSYKVEAKFAEISHRFAIAVGDIFRLEIGNLAPKYRSEIMPNGELKLLTKRIQNCVDKDYLDTLTKLLDKNIHLGKYHGKKEFEGVGFSTYLKVTCDDNDLHLGNFVCANISDYYIVLPIDPDNAFWPLPLELIEDEEEQDQRKLVSYPSFHPDAKRYYAKSGKDHSVINKLTYKDIGEQTEDDLITLPIIKYKLPKNYQFMERGAKPFSEAAALSDVVKNEVCYHRIKFCLLDFLKKFLIDFHFSRKESMLDFGEKVRQKVLSICKTEISLCQTSKNIKAFLELHQRPILQTIIYDLNTFFYDNHHYRPKNLEVWTHLWNSMVEIVIEKFNILLKAQNLSLTSDEIRQIKTYADKCESNYSEASKDAILFYKEQQRFAFAENELKCLPQRLISREKRYKEWKEIESASTVQQQAKENVCISSRFM
ncbi:MAG: hypothetical protein ACYCQI_15545 [Gammaproteobacteria bacterium]